MNAQNLSERALSSAVGVKISSEAKIDRAKATFWSASGLGVLALLLGGGISAAFFGYARTIDNGPAADKIADAIVRAIDKVQLKTTGEVQLASDQLVAIRPGAEVSIAPGGTVQVDPSSTIKVEGSLRSPGPTMQQLQPGATSASKAAVTTAFTIFKSVAFSDGIVVTGWNFANSDQQNPRYQYCYFSQQIEDAAQLRIDIARDGALLADAKERPGLNRVEAFKNCVWFANN